ncbi:MAG: flavin reductase [Pseudomonadota bacterium]
MVDKTSFRSAMSNIAGAVCVITTDGAHGRGGFTASAVCSVTDQPPTVLVCMNKSSRQSAVFLGNGRLCVNVLAGDQEHVSAAFAASTADGIGPRFDAGQWAATAGGVPALAGAAASLDTRIVERHEVGTHLILICEIDAIASREEADALVYLQRRYCRLPASAAAPPAR